MARKANMAQTEIPVGNEVGRKHKPPCPRAGKKF